MNGNKQQYKNYSSSSGQIIKTHLLLDFRIFVHFLLCSSYSLIVCTREHIHSRRFFTPSRNNICFFKESEPITRIISIWNNCCLSISYGKKEVKKIKWKKKQKSFFSLSIDFKLIVPFMCTVRGSLSPPLLYCLCMCV